MFPFRHDAGDSVLCDADLHRRARLGERAAVEALLGRHLPTLFRLARSITGERRAAELAVAAACARVLTAPGRPTERWGISPCLARETLEQARRRCRLNGPDGRTAASGRLAAAIDSLPPALRPIFVLRAVEGLGVAATGRLLSLPDETVRERYAAARRRLHPVLAVATAGRGAAALSGIFACGPADGERLISKVLDRLDDSPMEYYGSHG